MQFDTSIRGDKTVVVIREERLDLHNSGILRDYVVERLEAGSGAVILDLSQVRFMASSGLGALISCLKNARLRSIPFALAGIQPPIQSLLTLVDLQHVFEIYSDADEAVKET